MLSAEQNERFTKVGAGTPMGEVMRRYWHPIAASVELNEDNPTKEIRLLGEDLVLFRTPRQDRVHRALLRPPQGEPLVRRPRGGRHPLRLPRMGLRRDRRLP